MPVRTHLVTLCLAAAAVTATAAEPAARTVDVCVYGATSAGVTAAIQSVRMGKTVALIEPSNHVGGLTSGGLGYTDSGDKNAVGGISREFYQRVKKYYDRLDSWKHENRDDYKNYRAAEDAMWTFEPRIAEQILREMLVEHKIAVDLRRRLDRSGKGVAKEGDRIVSIRMESGETYFARMFIDATYEGDLMAAAGVSYAVGREPNSQYGEMLNGVQRKLNTHNHRFTVKVDPFVKPGDPKSGLLFGIDRELPADDAGDHRLQAFCFRMCMCRVKENSVPFPKPEGYDERMYELLFRNFEAGDLRFPMKPDMMPNGKTDTNNNCAVSTDFIGQNHRYADGSYAERDRIIKNHEVYQKGLMWSLANHPRVPKSIRDQMAVWGLPKDEFVDNGHWPHQIYVREARRMTSDYVMTENDCRRKRVTPGSIGMGSYNMDSHNCSRYVTAEGFVQNEGDVQVSPGGPYQIAYQSIVPKAGECANLLVPVCVASSHIAYGSIRMEPVFMILGQSAATAGVLAMDGKIPVQKLEYAVLRERLLKDKQVLELAPRAKKQAIPAKSLPGIVVDDDQAKRTGFEAVSASLPGYVGDGYRHDGNMNPGKQSAVYTPTIPDDGMYEVRVSYTPSGNRATNVPVRITHDKGHMDVKVNQQKKPPIDGMWVSLGKFRFTKGTGGSVTISNTGVDGFVAIDAVQWLKAKE